MNRTKIALISLALFTTPMILGGCAAVAGVAAADYFIDDNDVCNGKNDVGLLDSDCHD